MNDLSGSLVVIIGAAHADRPRAGHRGWDDLLLDTALTGATYDVDGGQQLLR